MCLLRISEQKATSPVHKQTDFYKRDGGCFLPGTNTAYEQKLRFVLKNNRGQIVRRKASEIQSTSIIMLRKI